VAQSRTTANQVHQGCFDEVPRTRTVGHPLDWRHRSTCREVIHELPCFLSICATSASWWRVEPSRTRPSFGHHRRASCRDARVGASVEQQSYDVEMTLRRARCSGVRSPSQWLDRAFGPAPRSSSQRTARTSPRFAIRCSTSKVHECQHGAGSPSEASVGAVDPSGRSSPAPLNRRGCSCCGGRRCRDRTWP